jgi:hypothetical protein
MKKAHRISPPDILKAGKLVCTQLKTKHIFDGELDRIHR